MDKVTNAVIVIIVIGVSIAIFLGIILIYSDQYQYTILDTNSNPNITYDSNFNPIYSLTIYCKIRCNVDNASSITLLCSITNVDLSIVTHSQTIQMSKNQVQTVTFTFSNSEMHGQIASKYLINYPDICDEA